MVSTNSLRKHSLLLALTSLCISAQGWEPQPITLGVRHIESGGVGYNQGYSTIAGFIGSKQGNFVPFLDLKGHIFNNGKWDTNAGIGFRGISGCRSYGVNSYYDYRNTEHQHYNQLGVGLETLGENWDLLVNGYLPLGDKKSRFYQQRTTKSVSSTGTPITFDHFGGNQIFLSTPADNITIKTKRKREFAMKGIDALVRFPLWKGKNANLSGAIGPYYYDGYFGKYAAGGRAKVVAKWKQFLGVGVNVSYDNLFHARVQGEVSLSFALGPKEPADKCPSYFNQKLYQEVDRAEIIVLDRHKSKKKKSFTTAPGSSVAIDPATGLPYTVWFVNNTSHSNGTFESPFNTLLAAQMASSANDIIYVYPGDGTSTGMDAGIALKNSQKLFGAGMNQTIATTVGTITLPAQASGMPQITGSSSGFIACQNNDEISGIHVVINDGLLSGIDCSNITNAFIHNNTIDGSAIVSGNQLTGLVSLTSCAGEINVVNNTFDVGNASLSGQLFGIHLFSTAPGTTYTISNNQFTSPFANGSAGIEFGVRLFPIGDFNSIDITNNLFSGLGWDGSHLNFNGHGIAGYGFSGVGKLTIDHNTFSQTGTFGPAIVYVQVRSGGNIASTITNNTWVNSLQPAQSSVRVINQAASAHSCLTLHNNVSDSTGNAYVLNNTAGGSFTADVSANTGTVQDVGSITPGTCP